MTQYLKRYNNLLNIVNQKPTFMKQFLQLFLMLSAPLIFSQTPCVGGMASGFPCNGLTLQGKISIANLGGKAYPEPTQWKLRIHGG